MTQSPQNPKFDRYKHAFKEGKEGENKDQQVLLKANEYLRECLRDLNYYIGKKVEKQREQIYQKFNSQSNIVNQTKRTEEQAIEWQLAIIEKEQKNNNFILQQQEKELKQIDSKISGIHVNQQFELVQQIENLNDQIKKERLEIKQNRQYNFMEGKYLDNVVNNNSMPKVVEIQQNKQLDSLKLQNANSKLREQIKKKDELISEYNKKISGTEKDYKEALQKERSLKNVNLELLAKIKAERKKVDALEGNIDIINHNIEREKFRYETIAKDLNLLMQHTDEKINTIEMQIRQLNSDSQQLRQFGQEVSPNFLSKFPSSENPASNIEEDNVLISYAAESGVEQSKGSKNATPSRNNSSNKRQVNSITNLKKPSKITSSVTTLKVSQNKQNYYKQDEEKQQKNSQGFEELINPSSSQSKQGYSESKPNMSSKKIPSYIGQEQESQVEDNKQISNKSLSHQQLEPTKQNKNHQSEHNNKSPNDLKFKAFDNDNGDNNSQQQQQQHQKQHEEEKRPTQIQEKKIEKIEQKQEKKQNSDIDLDDQFIDNKQTVQEHKQPAQKTKPQKVDQSQQHEDEFDNKKLTTQDLHDEISQIKNSSQEQKQAHIKGIQQSLNEIQNNIQNIESNSKSGQEKKAQKNYLDLTPESNKSNKNKQTKSGNHQDDEEEDLDKIEEEIRKLEEEMKRKEQAEKDTKQQEQQKSKTEIPPAKKIVAQKETSFTQTETAENGNNGENIFTYKNRESLANINEDSENKKMNSNHQNNNSQSKSNLQPIDPNVKRQSVQEQSNLQKKSIPTLEPIKGSQKNIANSQINIANSQNDIGIQQKKTVQQQSQMDYNNLDFEDSQELVEENELNEQQQNQKYVSNGNQVNNDQKIKATYHNQNYKQKAHQDEDSFDLDLLQDSNVKQHNQSQKVQKQAQNKQQNNQQANHYQNQNINSIDYQFSD